ncbi:MAG TPA: response regulator [Polyangiales bacterium]|nr:response regulator [Polyangiales bacterium]
MDEARLRILLVEDDEEDYLLTSRILNDRDCGKFDATWVRSYDAALVALRTPYDVCLVDYHLGAETGLSLIERAIVDGFGGPMILLTGRGDHDIDVRAMKAGAADYMVKDQITPQLMERVIRHSIERKGAAKTLHETETQLRQSQKMEAVGMLAGGIAHDFNNLLSIILCYSELLAGQLKIGDPMRAALTDITEAGVRAAALTQQLLAFSRQQALQLNTLDLNEVFTAMEAMLQRVIGEDVELVLLTSQIGAIRADRGQVEQIIMNLAVNARDAMPRGGKLTFETAEVVLDEAYASQHIGVTPGLHIMLAISDNGIGMDDATLARVFEPFFTTKALGKGTGLGLATVFGIVRQSGATIWTSSEVGKGTTFEIYFPIANGAPVAMELTPPVERRTLRGSETILVVEDEARVRAVICTILRKYGYNVLQAHSGGDALLVVEQHVGPIHLLLTDVVMPHMSGRELAERLMKTQLDMKLLYMSGYTDDAIVRHGIVDSSVAFIQKPITPVALALKVRETLSASSRAANQNSRAS